MERIQTLFITDPEPVSPLLPEELRVQYDGDLRFPEAPEGRPYVIANFVSTIDGVVSFNIPGQSAGGQISGSNDGDRFIMALLRASADAVLVASGTVEAVGHEHVWTPQFVYPARRELYRYYRTALLKKTEYPLVVIVSGTGTLSLDRAIFHTAGVSVLIMTTDQGLKKLKSAGLDELPSTEARVQPDANGHISPAAILQLLKEEFGVASVLNEGGPTLLGTFLACRLIDELFLTIAPQIAGRTREHFRPALVENTAFTPAAAPWLKLLSAKKAADHLYLRYGGNEALPQKWEGL
jgi:riboflavin biosynthesis pyrimidine reductase